MTEDEKAVRRDVTKWLESIQSKIANSPLSKEEETLFPQLQAFVLNAQTDLDLGVHHRLEILEVGKQPTTQEPMKTMSIHTPNGAKVVFAYPKNGYSTDQEHAARHLTVGSTYTVKEMDVHKFSSTVEFVELSDFIFNTVHFKEVQP